MYSWFLIDFLGTFPFELFIGGDSASSRKSLKLIKYFKIPKLLRVSRVMKYIREKKSVYELFQVFVLVFTLIHLGSCFWMLILSPCNEDTLDMISDYDTLCRQENVGKLYTESFHLSAAMILGVSNSHVIGESSTLDLYTEKRETHRIQMYVISTLFMIGGLFIVALLISELNVFISGKKQGSATFQRKFDRVKHEMEYYSVPDDLQMQVKAFYDYIWIHQKQYDDRIALLSDDQMSTDLKRKLALHLYKDIVSHISIFSDIDDLLLGEICLSLRTRIFLPNDMILFKGDLGKELFLIAKGVVEVLRDDLSEEERQQNPPIYLDNGCFFGEIALIMETRRTCSVQAHTICEVNILQQKTFDTILDGNPRFARSMNELIVARQLEKSVSRRMNELASTHKLARPEAMADPDGIHIRVTKQDMDTALSVVEKNMKRGLVRRRLREDQVASERSDSGSCTPPHHHHHHHHPTDDYNDPTQISAMSLDSDNACSKKSQPLHLQLRPRLDEVTKIIDDIAYKSTKLQQSQSTDSPHRKRSSTTGSLGISSSKSLRKLSGHSFDVRKSKSKTSQDTNPSTFEKQQVIVDETEPLVDVVGENDRSQKQFQLPFDSIPTDSNVKAHVPKLPTASTSTTLRTSFSNSTSSMPTSVPRPPFMNTDDPSLPLPTPGDDHLLSTDIIMEDFGGKDSDMLVNGNFNLDKVRVNIGKVHKSILKVGPTYSNQDIMANGTYPPDECMERIEDQLRAQGKLLKMLYEAVVPANTTIHSPKAEGIDIMEREGSTENDRKNE